MSKGMVIIVEGVPGCGKTSFCRSYLKQNKDAVIMEEWVDVNLLSKYISNMEEYAFEFQCRAQTETLKNIELALQYASEGKTVLIDRGVVGNECFAEIQHESGFISDEELKEYKALSSNIDATMFKTCYLKCDAEVALRRISNRGRNGESSYTINYLQKLVEKHDLKLAQIRRAIVIDVNQEELSTSQDFLQTPVRELETILVM